MKVRALAELVHHIRPDWNRGGILAALTAQPERAFPELTRAALDAAWDRTADTPAVIAHRDGTAWATRPEPVKPTATPGTRACRNCGRFHVLIDGILEPCYRHDQEVTQRGIAKVRGALNAAKAKTEEIVRESPKPKVPQHRVEANQRGVDAARDALRHAHAMPTVDGSDDAR